MTRGGKREGAGRPRTVPDAAEFRYVAELLVAQIGKADAPAAEDLTRLAQYFFTQARKHEQADRKSDNLHSK